MKKIYEGELLTGHEAEGYGLVDGIDNFIDYMDVKYPGIDLKECSHSGYFERVEDLVGPFMVKSDFEAVKRKVSYGLMAKMGSNSRY